MHVYELLKSRHSELKARLGIEDDKCIEQCLLEMRKKLRIVKDDDCRIEALRKAYMIFNGSVPLEYFFAAAIFGSAPNLIIGNLQQRALKYSTDLRNSQGEGSSKED